LDFKNDEKDRYRHSRSKLAEDRGGTLRVSDALRAGLAKGPLGASALTFLLGTAYVAEGLDGPHVALANELRRVRANAGLLRPYRSSRATYLQHGDGRYGSFGDGVAPAERASGQRAVREGCLQGVQQVDDYADELLNNREEEKHERG